MNNESKDMDKETAANAAMPANFIEVIINEDNKTGKYGNRVHTRFPPEPNGYLHIGHAKSICLNFGLALKYGGKCNLRFDDTNPTKEDVEYVDSIQEDVRWLGFDWDDRKFYASDYFEKIYELTLELIKKGKAYVCDLSAGEMREYRGTLTEPGKESPYRNRSVAENLSLFEKMRLGEFPEGSRVLRAKIDMSSPNLNMRDPVLYRIIRAPHHRTGDTWCIYPMYDYAHPISDSLEGVTHSICTLEFADHRPLYDWTLEALEIYKCQQIEFARLNLTNTIMSKRYLRRLVEENYVSGWDDPRMPTISGLRRRGYTPEAIRDFCDRIGVAKSNSTVDIALLEHCIREDLNTKAPRVMAVLKPLKIIIDNYPDGQVEEMTAENNPENPEMGSRTLPFTRELYIEQDDFMENPPKKYFRLTPGAEVRLKHAYIIKCEHVIKDEQTGEIVEVHCTYDPDTKSGSGTVNRKVKGVLHWVSAAHAAKAEVRLYDYLLTAQQDQEEEAKDFVDTLNPDSLEVLTACLVEPSIKTAQPGSRFQFMRQGYFVVDRDSTADLPVFSRIVSLKDSWAKLEKK
ncbi:glutamine--tRNA ligase/YqeY domain fusion protein [Sporomusa sphaeroides]|uniref:Glutamine--tRNA ligase n=1 Tax=Sporomusa sphaeroides DSM 2875 TaxID=1337886 RepID=A0ABM9W2K2_9FIRM|nr:glutamine--tRNA ligase/YqeY domain fusion protein [Sporomusa sphaeroides]OLS55665.1 glutamine--tRNA ligase [Sporomusa sphaeroides DSM 2875]CVK19409.1 Glutamine--tRNA ligase [Sporomusa sphaeroides DSM 2875]